MVVDVLCFLQGVLLQRVASLGNIHVTAYLLEGYNLVVVSQNFAYLLQFVLVIGSKYYFHYCNF